MARYLFGDVVREVKTKIDRSNNPYEFYIAGEHMDSEDIHLHRRGTFKGSDVGPAFIRLFKPGQILYGSRRTYLKKVAVADFEGITSNTTFVLEVKDENKLCQELLPFLMLSDGFTEYSIKKSKGSTNPYILFSDLAKYEFNLPKIEKQRDLVKFLLAIDETKVAYKKLILATDELVKSQFIEMFGDPVLNSRQHTVRKLADLGELNRGVSKARPRNTPDLLGGPYPLIQTGEVAAAQLYVDSYENTYSEKGLAQSRMWLKGTLCITIAANIAQTAILAIDACFPDSVVGFIPGNEVTQIYMHYWFSFFQKILDEQAPQVAQKNINLKILSNLDVMVPPLELQKQFENFVEQSDKSKFALQEAIKDLDALSKKIIAENLIPAGKE